MSERDNLCSRIRPHPFPDDYKQERLMMKRFWNPMMEWGGLMFCPLAYDKPSNALRKFIDYYVSAYDDIKKRAKLQALLFNSLSREEMASAISDLSRENPNYFAEVIALTEALDSTGQYLGGGKPPEKATSFLSDLTLKRLRDLGQRATSVGRYDAEAAAGTFLKTLNQAVGWLAIGGRLATGNVPMAIADFVAMTVGKKAGDSLITAAKSAPEKERFMAYIRHYIIFGKIRFHDFAAIIFQGTGIARK